MLSPYLVFSLQQNELAEIPWHCWTVISQWAVYAIHNLTEENERNQAFIAQMEQHGPADKTALESLGLKVELRDQKLILKSVKQMPDP